MTTTETLTTDGTPSYVVQLSACVAGQRSAVALAATALARHATHGLVGRSDASPTRAAVVVLVSLPLPIHASMRQVLDHCAVGVDPEAGLAELRASVLQSYADDDDGDGAAPFPAAASVAWKALIRVCRGASLTEEVTSKVAVRVFALLREVVTHLVVTTMQHVLSGPDDPPVTMESEGTVVDAVSTCDGGAIFVVPPSTDASVTKIVLGSKACHMCLLAPEAGVFTMDESVTQRANLVRELTYEEMQEVCAHNEVWGLRPTVTSTLREHNIPLLFAGLQTWHLGYGTHVVQHSHFLGAKHVALRHNVTMIQINGCTMWHAVGFLSKVFTHFAEVGISIDLITTSQTNITVTLDSGNEPTRELMQRLSELGEVEAVQGCSVATLVGQGARSLVHRLGPALKVFEHKPLHMICQSSADVSTCFVLDAKEATRLCDALGSIFFLGRPDDGLLGPTRAQLLALASHPNAESIVKDAAASVAAATATLPDEFSAAAPVLNTPLPSTWWVQERDALLALAGSASPAYVYHQGTIERQAKVLLQLKSIQRVFYAVKANHHADVLRTLVAQGVGMECVSPAELDHVRALFPDLPTEQLLFTPNFAPRSDYEHGFACGAMVTVDSVYALQAWPSTFAGRDIVLRLDPGQGRGHHEHVKTAGKYAKFGIALDDVETMARLVDAAGANVIGLHSHVGSGILDGETWFRTAALLAGYAPLFPKLRFLDLGGGLGVPYQVHEHALDLTQLDAELAKFHERYPELELCIEPGRFFVAESGVLLATVTQLKVKSGVTWIGVNTGFNSLLRPALYGSHHEIFNLTKLHQPDVCKAEVVGPICESGDVLGHARSLPETQEGDVLLIAMAGAYGHTMSSHYNMREPAQECWLPSTNAE